MPDRNYRDGTVWLAFSKVSVRQDGEGVVDSSVLSSRDIWWRTFMSQLWEGEAEVPQRDLALVSDFCQLGSCFQTLPK